MSRERAAALEREYNGPGHPPQKPVPASELTDVELLQSFPIPTRRYCGTATPS